MIKTIEMLPADASDVVGELLVLCRLSPICGDESSESIAEHWNKIDPKMQVSLSSGDAKVFLSAAGARRVIYLLQQSVDMAEGRFVRLTENGYEHRAKEE